MSLQAPPSRHARRVLELLRDYRNVILTGPPGTGKSTLLSEVSRLFELELPTPTVHEPLKEAKYVPDAVIPFPKQTTVVAPATPIDLPWLPSPSRENRKVFSTVFDQSMTHRDFMRGVSAQVGIQSSAGVTFYVTKGILYRANEHAFSNGGASLLVIDEINRGPAVKIFGGTIAAIEADKRLGDDGLPILGKSLYFETLDDAGEPISYALASHLYILAVMNLADTSIEPLDTAFLRRFTPYRLEPDADILRAYFGLTDYSREIQKTASSAADVFVAIVSAWEAINEKIAIGRGEDFCIGHGVLMSNPSPPPEGDASVEAAVKYVRDGWSKIQQHIDEVFFGNTLSIAEVLNVGAATDHPYQVERVTFAGQSVTRLMRTQIKSHTDFYRLLYAVAQS